MRGNMFAFMFSRYDGAPIEVQKKARMMVLINIALVLASGSVLLFIIFGLRVNATFIAAVLIFLVFDLVSLFLVKYGRYGLASLLSTAVFAAGIFMLTVSYEARDDFNVFYIYLCYLYLLLIVTCLISRSRYNVVFAVGLGVVSLILVGLLKFTDVFRVVAAAAPMEVVLWVIIFLLGDFFALLTLVLNQGVIKVAEEEAGSARKSGTEARQLAESNKALAEGLLEIIRKAKEIIVKLNSSAREIETASLEQTSGATEHASGVTEVSATLQELSATARQITGSVKELVSSSGEVISLLEAGGKELAETVIRLEEVGALSRKNAEEIGELGKRSALINEMVDMIKEVANKINILSINASIEASRSGEAGSGFSVVAAEIRQLSKETLASAKNVEKAAREIKVSLQSIVNSSESESGKVVQSGGTVKAISEKMDQVAGRVNSNYTFTQKIDASTRQQETGSRQAADTMRQMAEISRQTAETARQTAAAVKDIVRLGEELDDVVRKIKLEEEREATAGPAET